jgi:hypothetical protein
VKRYISTERLKELVMNLLINKAKKRKINPEDFSFSSIKNSIGRKFEVSNEKLEKVLSELNKEGKIIERVREYYVYIPVGFENKFKRLIKPIDSALLFASALVIGFFIWPLIVQKFGLPIVINLAEERFYFDYLFFGLFIPLILGSIVVAAFIKLYYFLYSNIDFFREMINFFGGSRIWGYALLLGTLFLFIYVVFSWITHYEVNPYFAVAIFSGVFMSVLYRGRTN